MRNPDRFGKFYFAKVGLGEACGGGKCVIDVFEFKRKGGAEAKQSLRQDRPGCLSIRAWAVKYGFLSRKRRP